MNKKKDYLIEAPCIIEQQEELTLRIFRERRDIEICCYGAADVIGIGIGSAASVVTLLALHVLLPPII